MTLKSISKSQVTLTWHKAFFAWFVSFVLFVACVCWALWALSPSSQKAIVEADISDQKASQKAKWPKRWPKSVWRGCIFTYLSHLSRIFNSNKHYICLICFICLICLNGRIVRPFLLGIVEADISDLSDQKAKWRSHDTPTHTRIHFRVCPRFSVLCACVVCVSTCVCCDHLCLLVPVLVFAFFAVTTGAVTAGGVTVGVWQLVCDSWGHWDT